MTKSALRIINDNPTASKLSFNARKKAGRILIGQGFKHFGKRIK